MRKLQLFLVLRFLYLIIKKVLLTFALLSPLFGNLGPGSLESFFRMVYINLIYRTIGKSYRSLGVLALFAFI